MASELKVDKILNAGGDQDSGINLATNDTIKFDIATSTKATMASTGIVTIVGEGGTTTTNLQQGLSKQWVSVTNTTLSDSLNTSSISDGGDWLNINYTNNMANDDYAAATGGSQSGYTSNRGTAIGVSNVATNTRKEWPMTEAEAGYAGGAFILHTSTLHGDLA